LPDPVKSLVSASGDLDWKSWVEKGGVGEFEAARVYLARWARIVAEEGERARRREAHTLPSDSNGGVTEEQSELGIFELLQSTANLPTPTPTRDPKHPIEMKDFEAWFDKDGRPTISIENFRQEVFRRGISDKGVTRKRIWPFLLDVYEWDATETERRHKWEEKMYKTVLLKIVEANFFFTNRQLYQDTEDEWFGKPEVFDRSDILEVWSFILLFD
jgi:TBC1 domain family member 15